ncbi:hypothetical protein [Actinomadura mexicana]|uniref:hypothetical protein n=1 Tax=Actinomadura mexicana TaxID=134959 RepID=UPI001C52A0CD|nr:hypothetical protein [Actinomadura mexicana]
MRGPAAEEIVNRPKSAYPASRDPGYVETLKNLVIEMIDEPGAPLFDLLDRVRVRDGRRGGPFMVTAADPGRAGRRRGDRDHRPRTGGRL